MWFLRFSAFLGAEKSYFPMSDQKKSTDSLLVLTEYLKTLRGFFLIRHLEIRLFVPKIWQENAAPSPLALSKGEGAAFSCHILGTKSRISWCLIKKKPRSVFKYSVSTNKLSVDFFWSDIGKYDFSAPKNAEKRKNHIISSWISKIFPPKPRFFQTHQTVTKTVSMD